jgi:hypothetical protein
VLFEGSSAVIDRATRDLRSLLGKCGIAETLVLDGNAAAGVLQETIDAYIEPLDDRSITYRSAGPPSTVWARTRAACAIVSECRGRFDFIADLRTGDAIVRLAGTSPDHAAGILPETNTELRRDLPGITVLAGDPLLRARVDAWGPIPPVMDTLRSIKARFDPDATLAPGRYVGGL